MSERYRIRMIDLDTCYTGRWHESSEPLSSPPRDEMALWSRADTWGHINGPRRSGRGSIDG